MEVTVTKTDIITGYVAKILTSGSNFLVLPFILSLLTPEEVGMNYIMLSVSALVQLADFGFCAQIGRNVTYIISGSKQLHKREINVVEASRSISIDFHLLAVVIETAKFIYRRLSLCILLIMITAGTYYMSNVTDNFQNVNNSFWIWITFSVSTYFNFYFLYYNSILNGAGKVTECNIALVLTRVTYLIISIVLLLLDFGLFSVVIANLISPFVSRAYSYYKFYDKDMKDGLFNQKVLKDEKIEAIKIIWYTASRSGTNMIGHYVGTQAGMFLTGIYLSLSEAASWGLMTQLYGVVSSFSMSMFMSQLPLFARFNIQGNINELRRKSSESVIIFLVLSIMGAILINEFSSFLLSLIGSQTELPSKRMLWTYSLTLIIINNAQIFACLMTSKNKIPSPKATLFTAFVTLILMVVSLKYLHWGLWGVLLSPFCSGIAYTLWRWPQIILSDYKTNYFSYLRIGIHSLQKRITR